MPSDKKSSTLLLVEDSEDDAFFFGRALHKSGLAYSVHHVINGALAVEFLRGIAGPHYEGLPHAIFLDLKMPVLNGFEVLDWLRSQSFPSQMRVFVLSGSEHHEDRERCLRMGATEYLVKPVKGHDFQRLLAPVPAAPPESGGSL